MDMWRFLTNEDNTNGSNNLNDKSNADNNSDNNNNNENKGQGLCLGLSPDEVRTFVRQGNLGYLKVNCLPLSYHQ